MPLINNCTISTVRGGVFKLRNVKANRYQPRLVFTSDGQYVQSNYVLDGVPAFAGGPTDADDALDITEGDLLTENGRPAGIVTLITPYPTRIVHTEITVVRSMV